MKIEEPQASPSKVFLNNLAGENGAAVLLVEKNGSFAFIASEPVTMSRVMGLLQTALVIQSNDIKRAHDGVKK